MVFSKFGKGLLRKKEALCNVKEISRYVVSFYNDVFASDD
jgi:hypothetical protein